MAIPCPANFESVWQRNGRPVSPVSAGHVRPRRLASVRSRRERSAVERHEHGGGEDEKATGRQQVQGLILLPSATHDLTRALAAGDEDAVETFYQRYFD